MTGPGQQNDFAKHSKEMTGSVPKQMDNKDFGKKRTAKAHKFSVKDTKTGKLYWAPAIMEKFSTYLISEATEKSVLDKITTLPGMVINELKKLITKGAKDLNQNWEDAKELTDTAYHVANIRRPIPDQRGAWKQYEDLLKFSVNQLWDTRGKKGDWRAADVVYGESHVPKIEPLFEAINSKRFFVKIPNAIDVEVDGSDMTEVIKDLTNKIRRQGGHVEVRQRNDQGALLVVWKKDVEIEEIIIQSVS
jgi:hypothetical protein